MKLYLLCVLLLALPVLLDLAEPREVVEAVHPGLVVVRLIRRSRRSEAEALALDCAELYAADERGGPGDD